MKRLNLGCGQKLMKGYINVDNNPVTHPDIYHNLEKIPYPFQENEFNKINMDHVLEHLSDPLSVIQELYRIATDGAIIEIRCPHFSCNFHPGHKSFISSMLFDKFQKIGDDYYGNCEFKVILIKLKWLRKPKVWPLFLRIIHTIISFFANLDIGITERIWCWWVGGFEEIYFKVRVIKAKPKKNSKKTNSPKKRNYTRQ